MNIGEGIVSNCDTRFSTWYYVATSIVRCMPAIKQLVRENILEFKTPAVCLICIGETETDVTLILLDQETEAIPH